MQIPRVLLRSLITSVALITVPFRSSQAQTPGETLERAVTTYRAANTMRVKFEQTLTNPLLGSSLISQGELLRKKPKFLSISFSGEKDRIVADGKMLWVYLPSSAPGQVIKMPVGSTPGALIDPFGQVLTAPADKFNIVSAGTATIRGRDTHAVTMTPKQTDDALFTQATVWVDDKDAVVRKIETTEPSGVTRQIVITKYSPNVSLSKNAFVFTPPADMIVVDGQKLGK